ncbi:MAG: hypothetical protein H7840_10105, partial [Alphaproteobacteria bacterium]
ATLFRSRLAEDAEWRPPAGPPVPVRVIASTPDRTLEGFAVPLVTAVLTITVRVADVPDPEGGAFLIRGTPYSVQPGARRGVTGSTWTIRLEPME